MIIDKAVLRAAMVCCLSSVKNHVAVRSKFHLSSKFFKSSIGEERT